MLKKRIFGQSKKWMALLLVFVLMVAAVPMNAFAFEYASGERVAARVGRQFVGYDGSKVYGSSDNYALRYRSDGSTYFESYSKTTARGHLYLYTEFNTDEQWVYCAEYGVDFGNGSRYTSENGNNSDYFLNLPAAIRYGIRLALTNGWQPGKALPISGINQDDFFYATQTIIWEYQQGVRKSPTTLVDNGPIKADQFYKAIKGTSFEKAYQWILQQMVQHSRIPSFAGENPDEIPTYELQYDSTSKQYSLTLTDSNNIGIDLAQVNGGKVSVTRQGNRYTFTSSEAIQNPICMEYKKDIILPNNPLLIWGSPGYQTMVTGLDDPVRFYMNIKTEAYGGVKLVKTSEDGKVGNVPFHISGNGIDKDVRTEPDGTILLEDLQTGVYEITELTDERYEPQATKRVTVVAGQTSTVTFNNTLKCGDLTVTKTAEDGFIEDKTFHLYGTSLSGLPVDEYAVTNERGVATFEDVLISGNQPYTLEEVGTEDKYVVPEAQEAVIEWNKVTHKSFDNILKKWRATLTKSDSETGTAQGDASLQNAEYGLFKGSQLVKSYFTGPNGDFVTDWYPCGDDWTIRELEPSTGYLLNLEIYHVGAEAQEYELEYNELALDVGEDIQKGKVALIKHSDDGSTGIEHPEENAEFQVFLRSAGSYENARETERDILLCDEFGYAESKELPYGWYRVHQTKGWPGREFIDDFDVFISKDGKVYRFLINNANFESRVMVVKKDGETGSTVPLAGHGYNLYDPEGSKISMTLTYPEVVEIDTFYTDSNGYLITPEPLPYGEGYSLVEIETVEPYVLDSTPVYFDITEENSSEHDGITVVVVEKANMPQKGTISLYKDGEVFSSVATAGGGDSPLLYQPVYAKAGLKDGVYDVVATEDVISGGVLRHHKGDTVATLTTGPDGWATSDPLYLSTYQIIERKAPYGMTLNPEPITATLSYAGQHVQLTTAEAHFTNERQRVEIDLTKILEQDELFQLGMNNEIQHVAWGLYAAEQLTAVDGSIIPADGLLEIASCDENGKAVFTTDVPVGAKLYVKEYATDSHYLISGEKYPVEFLYQGQDTATVHISVNDGETIENKLIRGDIYGLKVSEDGGAVSEAVFGLFRPDETEYNEVTALLTAESNESGEFTFLGIPYGNWIIKELSCPPQFVLSGELFRVTVSEQAQRIEIEAVNKWITGSVQTTKVDKDYPDNKLSEALFGIYLDVNGNKVFDKGIDTFVEHMEEIEPGIYRLDGLKYNGYFLYEERSPEGFIKDDRYYYFEIREDGAVVVIENEAGIGFINQPVVPEQPEEPEEPVQPPKTGDTSNLWLWIGIASASLGTLVLMCIKNRKRRASSK